MTNIDVINHSSNIIINNITAIKYGYIPNNNKQIIINILQIVSKQLDIYDTLTDIQKQNVLSIYNHLII